MNLTKTVPPHTACKHIPDPPGTHCLALKPEVLGQSCITLLTCQKEGKIMKKAAIEQCRAQELSLSAAHGETREPFSQPAQWGHWGTRGRTQDSCTSLLCPGFMCTLACQNQTNSPLPVNPRAQQADLGQSEKAEPANILARTVVSPAQILFVGSKRRLACNHWLSVESPSEQSGTVLLNLPAFPEL